MSSSTSNFSPARILAQLLFHGLVLGAILLGFHQLANRHLARTFGPSTARQIAFGFETVARQPAFDCILLGNSRIYRGLNPSLLPGRAFNFAQDGDSYNHAFYKLVYLEQQHKLPKIVILGIDYFMFSQLDPARLSYYQAHFPARFTDDYRDFSRSQGERGRAFGQFENERLNAQLDCRYSKAFALLWQRHPAPRSLADNGQYRLESLQPAEGYRRSPYNPVRRSAERLPVQLAYFRKCLQLCGQHQLRVVLVMPPINGYELDAYTPEQRRNFWKALAELAPGAQVLSYARDTRFHLKDYADFTHLKLSATDRLSRILAEDLRSRDSRW